jgi:hypothetical protein
VNLLKEIRVEIKGALKTVEEKEPAKTEPQKPNLRRSHEAAAFKTADSRALLEP